MVIPAHSWSCCEDGCNSVSSSCVCLQRVDVPVVREVQATPPGPLGQGCVVPLLLALCAVLGPWLCWARESGPLGQVPWGKSIGQDKVLQSKVDSHGQWGPSCRPDRKGGRPRLGRHSQVLKNVVQMHMRPAWSQGGRENQNKRRG